MLIVVTSNDCKKNRTQLGKNKSVDFDYDTCQVCVMNESYRCGVGKFSKKASLFPRNPNGNLLYKTSTLLIKCCISSASLNVIELKYNNPD